MFSKRKFSTLVTLKIYSVGMLFIYINCDVPLLTEITLAVSPNRLQHDYVIDEHVRIIYFHV